jgi:hypothetical protein
VAYEGTGMSDTIQYTTGLDVGQMQDYTGVAVLERTWVPVGDDTDQTVTHYAVRHLERLPPGTSYTEVAEVMKTRFADAPLTGTSLGVDLTAVGQPVLNLLRKAHIGATIRPITITGGNEAHMDEQGAWSVPKKELVSTLQVLLQARRLKVAPALPEAATLVQELINFKSRVTVSAQDSLDAWRDNPCDDLVLAIAIAAWIGERALRRLWVIVGRGPGESSTFFGPES